MRAAILREHGAIPEPGEHDDPAPSDGTEVLDVLAAGMNPVDVRIASGTFPNERHDPSRARRASAGATTAAWSTSTRASSRTGRSPSGR